MDDGAILGALSLPIFAGVVIGGLFFLFGVIAAANIAVTQALNAAGSRRLARRRALRERSSWDDQVLGTSEVPPSPGQRPVR